MSMQKLTPAGLVCLAGLSLSGCGETNQGDSANLLPSRPGVETKTVGGVTTWEMAKATASIDSSGAYTSLQITLLHSGQTTIGVVTSDVDQSSPLADTTFKLKSVDLPKVVEFDRAVFGPHGVNEFEVRVSQPTNPNSVTTASSKFSRK